MIDSWAYFWVFGVTYPVNPVTQAWVPDYGWIRVQVWGPKALSCVPRSVYTCVEYMEAADGKGGRERQRRVRES